jgi:hypothetical protein
MVLKEEADIDQSDFIFFRWEGFFPTYIKEEGKVGVGGVSKQEISDKMLSENVK